MYGHVDLTVILYFCAFFLVLLEWNNRFDPWKLFLSELVVEKVENSFVGELESACKSDIKGCPEIQ